MKFNSALALLAAVIFSCLLFSCSANPEKVSGQPAEKKSESDAGSSDQQFAVPTSVLPAGPATPNPYLQSRLSVPAAAEASFRAAVVAIQQKNWAQAETLLQPLAASYPALSGIPLNLGIVYRAQGDTQKAADAFALAIKLNVKNLDAYNQLAVLQREVGHFSEAEALYQQALKVWPFHAESQKNIAILYELYMGKPQQALPHYLAYRQLLPAPDKQLDSWIADLQRRLGGGKKAAPEPEPGSEKNASATEEK